MNTHDTVDAYVGSLLADHLEPANLPMPDAIAAPKAPTPAPPSPPPSSLPAPAPSPTPAAAHDNESAPVARSEVAESTRWLLMSVGENHYGLELLRIQEVVRVSVILSMRGTPDRVLGVMNLRGRAVPVIDLGLHLLGAQVDAQCEQSRIVVVEHDNELLGVLVSAVRDVATISPDSIEPAIESRRMHINGIARIGQLPVVLLDADDLFKP